MAISVKELIEKKEVIEAAKNAKYDLETSAGVMTVKLPTRADIMEALSLENPDSYLIVNTVVEPNLTESCRAFINRLTEYGHQYNGIYASWNWLSAEGAHHIRIEDLPDYVPYWVANYGSGNTFDNPCKDYLKEEYPDNIIRMHQFTDNLDGFGYDANIYYDN